MNFYHVDSFTDELFRGNPAGVCVLGDTWLTDELMLKIAAENNMSETAYVICKNGERHIRWFTPATEVVLCGHATLAAAHALFAHEKVSEEILEFGSASGPLRVARENGKYVLDFPAAKIDKVPLTDEIDCIEQKPLEVYKGEFDYLFVYENESVIENIKCDFTKMMHLDLDGIIVTAKSSRVDFVSRYFGPKIGIEEDPVTGSAHTLMVPYWHKMTGKTKFSAEQISPRGGKLQCEIIGDRVKIGGSAVTFIIGEIMV